MENNDLRREWTAPELKTQSADATDFNEGQFPDATGSSNFSLGG